MVTQSRKLFCHVCSALSVGQAQNAPAFAMSIGLTARHLSSYFWRTRVLSYLVCLIAVSRDVAGRCLYFRMSHDSKSLVVVGMRQL
jgi:hypothetical protein